MGGPAEGSPRRLHRLGGIRTQPEAARRQHLRQSGRREVGTRRAGAAGRAVILRPVRPPPDGELLGPSTGTARLSMRSPEPDAWAAPLLHLRRPARRRRDRPRASARRRADGDRGGGRGRTEVHGNPQRTTTHRRTRAAAGAIRSLARGTALRRLRSRQSTDRRAAREELGDGAAPRRGLPGAAGGSAVS